MSDSDIFERGIHWVGKLAADCLDKETRDELMLQAHIDAAKEKKKNLARQA